MLKYSNFSVLIFDLGNTILPLSPQKTIDAFKNLGMKENILQLSDEKKKQMDLFQKGHISPRYFIESLQQLCYPKASSKEIVSAWNAILLEFPLEHLHLLEQLKKTHKIILLSNTNALHQKHFEAKATKIGYPLNELFDSVFYSHIIGKSKPEKTIYEYVENQLSLSGERVLFLDDLSENIKAARRFGWDGYQVGNGKSILDLPL